MFSVLPALRWQRTLSTYVSHDMVTCRVILLRLRHLCVSSSRERLALEKFLSMTGSPVVELVPVEAVSVDGADDAQELAFRFP